MEYLTTYKRYIATALLGLLSLFFSAASTAKEARYPEFGNGRIEQKLVEAKEYMVSSANPYASEAGMRILEKGFFLVYNEYV